MDISKGFADGFNLVWQDWSEFGKTEFIPGIFQLNKGITSCG